MTMIFGNIRHGDDFENIKISLTSLLLGDFCTGAVLITFGAILGKTSPMQLLIVSLLETFFYTINENMLIEMNVADTGGTLFIHLFGAYFGISASSILSKPAAITSANNSASYRSNLFAMVGSLFLWCYWPSFNSALCGPTSQARTVVNTLVSICASCTATFGMSSVMHYIYDSGGGGKVSDEDVPAPAIPSRSPSNCVAVRSANASGGFSMVDIQNATLAGGVAVGASANMALGPGGAMCTGMCAGALSTIGFVRIQPWLQDRFGLHDTCGVHNLHGMPALLGGLISVAAAAGAKFDDTSTGTYSYHGNEALCEIFAKRCKVDEDGLVAEDRTAGGQALMQLLFLFFSLFLAIVTGVFTGYVAATADPDGACDFTDDHWEQGVEYI